MKKILIVDDTKNIRTLLTTCLELYGYAPVVAKNGFEALEIFRTENIDMAFIDIKMPEISGTEVLRQIRSLNINIPIVIMTAFATVKNAVECTKLGAVAYLQKPFTADKVKTLLDEIELTTFPMQDNISQLIKLAEKSISNSQLDEALTLLKKALAIDIECSDIYSLIARVYELKGDIKEAELFYNMAKQFM
jgi:Response regulator containing CheY-like receiver, AAA-type ATPase, and DNA-binding domains